MTPFSQRHGFSIPKEIKFREGLPVQLRVPIYDMLRRALNSRFLLERAQVLLNPYGIDSVPTHKGTMSVTKEEDDAATIAFKRIILGCAWHQVYGIIEDAFAQLRFHEQELAEPDENPRAYPLQRAINDYFLHTGIAWRMDDGKIVARGDETFESSVSKATAVLEQSHRLTAAQHLHEALQDLSRRPNADLSGAAYHAIGALECVARDVVGDPRATLGQILKQHPEFLPKPLDKALSQIWGYASEEARHVREGQNTDREEAELMVGLSATVTIYLAQKAKKRSNPPENT